MPCRVLCSSLVSVSLLLASSGAFAAEPLAPVKPWVVNYDTAECTAQRAYGDPADPLILVLGPSAWGNSYELMIVKSGSAPKFAEQLEGSVDFGQGRSRRGCCDGAPTSPSFVSSSNSGFPKPTSLRRKTRQP